MPDASPAHCDLLVVGGRILDPSAAGAVVDGHSVVTIGNEIVAVLPRAEAERSWRPATRIDAEGTVVCPGFVDAHVHLSALLGAGRPYAPATGPGLFAGACRILEIEAMRSRLLAMEVPDELVATVVRPALAAMVRSGFTSVVDAGSTGLAGLVGAISEVGIRGAVGPSLTDLSLDGAGTVRRVADAADLIERARTFAVEHDGAADGRVRTVFSAASTLSCSEEMLTAIAGSAADLGLPTHVHAMVSETAAEAHRHAHGRSEAERLVASGLLNHGCTAMHVGHVTDDDIAALRAAGATVNHNPLGNAMLGFGTAADRSASRPLAAEIPLVLGSDYTPSMVATPFDLMRSALIVHREMAAADDALTLEQALAMATNAGTSLGRAGRLGRIASGYLADLVLIDLSGPHHLGTRHPVPAVALRARPGDVRTVIIDGRLIVEDSSFVELDEAQLCAHADEAFRKMSGT